MKRLRDIQTSAASPPAPAAWPSRAGRLVSAGLVCASLAGGCSHSSGPTLTPTPPPGSDLPTLPIALSPAAGAVLATDTPTLTVQNARGFDAGAAEYTFVVTSTSRRSEFFRRTVPAGAGTTSVAVDAPLPRGMALSWTATARTSLAEAASVATPFRGPAVGCLSGRSPYAKAVVDWFVPECSLAQNTYNDPLEVLGPPDSSGRGPDMFTGFISLGDGGRVDVDMEGCAVDAPGEDVRVFQRASSEPVTLYAAGRPDGPFVLLRARQPCGTLMAGTRSGYCDFDLADGEVETARYFRIEDGELYPCPGDTVTEGADIDAIQILHQAP